MKMTIQVLRPAFDRAFECEKPFSRNRKPKNVAMAQKMRCNAPIHAISLVDCENSQATGAKPMSSRDEKHEGDELARTGLAQLIHHSPRLTQ